MNQVTEPVSKKSSEEITNEIRVEQIDQDSTQESEQPVQKKSALEQNQAQVAQIIAQTEKVNKQLTYFHKHKLFKVYNSIPQLLWFNLLKGVAFGLGSVLGATGVLSALVYLLSQIEFIPFIGEWVSEILEIVKTEVPN
jgi:hypothetical protein